MHGIIIKLLYAGSIFLLSLFSGLATLKISPRLAVISDALASGIFLGAAFLHMLPDAVTKFHHICPGNFPLAYLLCLVTFMLLLLLERWLFAYGNTHSHTSQHTVPIFLVLLLAMHSLVEGAAIGASHNMLESFIIFLAVFTHKGSESFALANNLQRLQIKEINIRKTILLFATVTPLGIIIASSILYFSSTSLGTAMVAIFNAVAAGTFLYLSTEHLIEGKKSFENIYEVIALIAGVTIMALVAIFV